MIGLPSSSYSLKETSLAVLSAAAAGFLVYESYQWISARRLPAQIVSSSLSYTPPANDEAEDEKTSKNLSLNKHGGAACCCPFASLKTWTSCLKKFFGLNRLYVRWFSEISEFWPGQAFSLEYEKILYQGRSEYQNILCLKSTAYGNVLILDGVINCTERDEFAYHEMLAHTAAMSHKLPEKALVIGGGDGGIIRELLRHESIKTVDLCEIDELVSCVSMMYLPKVSCCLDDPKVTQYFEDGNKFLDRHKEAYDLIIVDSSDPIGPACVLFKAEFYDKLYSALKKGGIAITQAECMWIHMDTIRMLREGALKTFKSVEYGVLSIPTYPCGTIGMLCCSKEDDEASNTPKPSADGEETPAKATEFGCSKPKRQLPASIQSSLKYYTPEVHSAAFVLPRLVHTALYD